MKYWIRYYLLMVIGNLLLIPGDFYDDKITYSSIQFQNDFINV